MNTIPTRRFEATEIEMQLLSLGGMRFQQSWDDLEPSAIAASSQANLLALLRRASSHGLHHIETAHFCGTSEQQLGWLVPQVSDPERLLQTKVPPDTDPGDLRVAAAHQFGAAQRRAGGFPEPARHQSARVPALVSDCRWMPGRGAPMAAARADRAHRHLNPHPHTLDSSDHRHRRVCLRESPLATALPSPLRPLATGVFTQSITVPPTKASAPTVPPPVFWSSVTPSIQSSSTILFCLSAPGVHTTSVGAARSEDFDLHLEAVERPSRGCQAPPPWSA